MQAPDGTSSVFPVGLAAVVTSAALRVCVCVGLAAALIMGCESSSGSGSPGGGIIDDPELNAYLKSVADAVAAEAGSTEYPVVVYDYPVAQSFALPGGSIALTREMLLLITSEAELACVLGHEIAHHELGHVDERFGDEAPPLDESHPLFNGWPQDEEQAADALSLQLCTAAGYEPLSTADLLLRAALFDSGLSFEQLTDADSDSPLIQRLRDVLQRIIESPIEGLRIGVPEYLQIRDRLTETDTGAEGSPSLRGRPFLINPVTIGEAWLAYEYYTQFEQDMQDATGAWIGDQCMTGDANVVPSNYYDAFGHCWSGCQVSRDCGGLCGNPGIWREIGREYFYGGDHDSFWQDWRNQNEGVRRSGDEGSCYGICEDAIESGELDLTAPYRKWWNCGEGRQQSGRPEGSVFNRYGDTVSPRLFGDPHVVTGDGLRYDFHGVGEFIALASTTDDFVVQARLGSVPALRASKTTAVAMDLEGDRVGVYLSGGGIVVRVNGEAAAPDATWVRLENGGRIQVDPNRLIAQWTDDTTLWAYGFGDVIDLLMTVAPQRQTRLTGILGNGDGDTTNEYINRDGELIDVPEESGEPRRVALYEQFGESWRIAPEESLFDYLMGDSSEDYQLLGFPDTLITIDDLGASVRDIAEDRCLAEGVTESPWLEACIFDVGFTGDAVWARSSRIASDPNSLTWREMYRAEGDVDGPETVVMEEFLGTAGQKQFFRILQNMSSLGLANWEVLTPSGARLFRRCVVACNQPGEHTLPESGVYTSRLIADSGESGTLVVARNVVPDPQVFGVGGATLLGPDLGAGAGLISIPGDVDAYRIEGSAGTRLTLSFLQQDSRLFFGNWRLTDPNGVELFDTMLPSVGTPRNEDLLITGTYVLTVDGGDSWPSDEDRGYGEYSISLNVGPTP